MICINGHRMSGYKGPRWMGNRNGWMMVARCPKCRFEERRQATVAEVYNYLAAKEPTND